MRQSAVPAIRSSTGRSPDDLARAGMVLVSRQDPQVGEDPRFELAKRDGTTVALTFDSFCSLRDGLADEQYVAPFPPPLEGGAPPSVADLDERAKLLNAWCAEVVDSLPALDGQKQARVADFFALEVPSATAAAAGGAGAPGVKDAPGAGPEEGAKSVEEDKAAAATATETAPATPTPVEKQATLEDIDLSTPRSKPPASAGCCTLQ